MERPIKIYEADGGFMMAHWAEWDDEDGGRYVRKVFASEDNENGFPAQAFQDMVYALAEECGYQYDKFAKTGNLRISFDKAGHKEQDKWEGLLEAAKGVIACFDKIATGDDSSIEELELAIKECEEKEGA